MNKNLSRVAVILFFLVFLFSMIQIPGTFSPTTQDISGISRALFGPYVVAFELLSVILVGAIIGMFYIAGRDD